MNTPEPQLAKRSPLHDFLAPDSIAIVGASADPTKRGYKAMIGLIKDGYQGAIYPINPKVDMILGVRTCPSLADVPGAIDLALICTPAATVPGLLVECGKKGVKGAVILASGFRETGPEGAKLEQQVLDAARAGGVRIIGPNTSGMFNLHKKVNLLALANVKAGDIGFISQSGNMLLSLVLEAEHNGHVGFSTYVGPGNQTDIGFNDYLRYLGEDPHTKVATLYVEGFRDGERFLQAAREITAVKPVVVYKSGSTEQGAKAASSHTGALAGSYAMTVDLLRQVGVSVVHDSDDVLPVAEGLGLLQKAPGKRVAVVSDGGGQATIASDRLAEAGLELAVLSETTRRRLGEILFPQASLVNPVDVAGSTDANPALLANCMEIVAEDENVDAVFLVGMFGGYSIRFAEDLLGGEMRGAESMIELGRRSSKPLVIYSLYAPIKPPALRRLHEAGLPVYSSIEHAVTVLKALGERGMYLRDATGGEPLPPAIPTAETEALFATAKNEERALLEFEAKALLRAHGVNVAPEVLVHDTEELGEVAHRFGDQALVMKVVSEDILHKSDAGGVKLNLRGEAALREAYDQIMTSCRAFRPSANIRGVLVTPMAKKGTEVIIGVSRDPIFGPVMMFGLGGIFVEILEDVAFRAIPLSRHDARSMVEQIKARKILEGARGEPAVDKEALVDLLLKVSSMVTAYPALAELDLNPILAYDDGYAVVDARVIVNWAV
ncbi:acetate--CoA ligase family protein [Cognatazoarcus halotolerans]|uniref:acetate--CoA ligase family protein n=1 Tax=Cognatazoarcus halotolerans TaxID=2686016 RepID=UPI001359DDE4|nr:acetate--CoA ligase [Cognatazoarcus halotolerans]MBX3680171.1 acetate--CoA ligase family protein [Rhodocyclaceae bacterium]MCB1902428.1 acetate--CoA ligase family protein [Rhodocyclaceae bacterium]MCP5307841.1 acetate--CoA ligase family protein [Zoogloeaceae bacterium]